MPSKKILGTSPKLNAKISLDAGSYYLNFKVIDFKKDVYKRQQIDLTVVSSSLGPGWYVLKDINDSTDFDYISNNGVMYNDILAGGNKKLPGKAICMTYQSGGYYQTIQDTSGVITLANQKVFHILSTRDIFTINANTLALFKTFKDEFYSTSTCNPQSIFFSSMLNDLYLINNNLLYSIYGMSANIGKFGAAKVGIYSLYKNMVPYDFGDILVFDMKSHSFYSASSSGTSLDKISDFKDSSDSIIPLSNMNYTMLNMNSSPSGNNGGQQGYALLKSLDSETYRIAHITYNGSQIINSFNAIPPDSKIINADVIAVPGTGNFVYFAVGSQIYYYMNAPSLDKKEVLLTTLSSNEHVTDMKHIHSANFNYLAVLSTSNQHWKLYLFPIESVGNPEITAKPDKVYEGNGNGKFLIYRFS